MKGTVVIKLSGKALGAEAQLRALFAAVKETPLVVVHGGGVEVDALFKALNLKVEKLNGLRVSPREQMPYISAALCGQCNKRVQALAIKSGLNAVGLLASDGGTLDVSMLDPKLGMVGRPAPRSGDFLNSLLKAGITPVLCSLCMDAQGDLYNVNADDAAAAVAALLKAPLYFLSDVKGVLGKDGQLIESLDAQKVAALTADGTVTEGMAVKVRSALDAAKQTSCPVYIGSVFDPDLASAIAQRRRLGTACLN